jgi:hypothetical protein
MKILIKRTDGDVIVIICRNKVDNTYSFVNLTKGHICECKFNSVDEAIMDMCRYSNIIAWSVIND